MLLTRGLTQGGSCDSHMHAADVMMQCSAPCASSPAVLQGAGHQMLVCRGLKLLEVLLWMLRQCPVLVAGNDLLVGSGQWPCCPQARLVLRQRHWKPLWGPQCYLTLQVQMRARLNVHSAFVSLTAESCTLLTKLSEGSTCWPKQCRHQPATDRHQQNHALAKLACSRSHLHNTLQCTTQQARCHMQPG